MHFSKWILRPQSHWADIWSRVSMAKNIWKIPAEICESCRCILDPLYVPAYTMESANYCETF